MWAPVWFGHDGDNCDAAGCPDGLTFEYWGELVLVRLRQGGENINDFGHSREFILCGNFDLELGQIDLFAPVEGRDELVDDL